MHTTPTHILNPDPTIRSTLLALLQLVSCEHQFSIHYIEVFCCEAVCLFFAIFSNIFLQTTSATLAIIYYILYNCLDAQHHPCQDSVCHYLCLTLQRCSSPSSYLLVMLVFSFLISTHHHQQPLLLLTCSRWL